MLLITASGRFGVASVCFPPNATADKISLSPIYGFLSLRASTISMSSKWRRIIPANSFKGVSAQYTTAMRAELGARPSIWNLSSSDVVKLPEYMAASNPQPIGFSGILLAKRQNSFYCTYFLHNRNVADTKSPYPIKRLEVIRWFNQKSMVFNQSLS